MCGRTPLREEIISVLIIKPEWLQKIMDPECGKTWEIRGRKCEKDGQVIYLAGSRTSTIYARVKFEGCHGPLTQDEWEANVGRHCVRQHTRPYGARTHAYQFGELEVARHPIPFERKRGAVIWQDVPIEHAVLTNAVFEAPKSI